MTFALTSRAEKSGKKFSNEARCEDRAAWWLKFAMRKLWNHFAPRVLLKAGHNSFRGYQIFNVKLIYAETLANF